MKRLFFILISLLLLLPASALQPVGQWEIYATFRTPKQICEGRDKVFFLADNSLFSYAKEDKEVRELSRLNVLSDNNISRIAADAENNLLVVVYANSNIDLIDMTTEATTNLPYLKNATMTSSKTINDITFSGDEVYLATDFGIVVLNSAKREIKTTYSFNEKICTAARQGDNLYCIRADRSLYCCPVDGIPYDLKNWEVMRNSYIDLLRPYAGGLLMLHQDKKLLFLPEVGNAIFLIGEKIVRKIEVEKGRLLVYTTTGEVRLYDENRTLTTTLAMAGTGYDPADVTAANSQNRLWIVDSGSVAALRYDDAGTLTVETELPCDNYQKVYNPFSITIADDRVYVSPAGVGYFNDEQNIDGYISILEDGKWSNILPEEIPVSKHDNYTWGNLYNIVIDPDDKDIFYVGTWFEGLYRFKNNRYDTHWNDENSPMGGSFDKWSNKAGGLAFDGKKNLYMLHFNGECGLSVMRRDETWYTLPYDELKNLRNLHQVFIPKKSSVKWVTCPVYDSFVFAFYENDTETIGDDITRKFTTFIDQNGEGIDGTIFFEMAEDSEGKLWVGTNRGPIVIAQPNHFAEKNFRCNRIKIARNDGTNLADYLLNDEVIQAVAIDGADRKWFGTHNSGAYLVSADGQQTIYHFTADNSPLPSDNIYDIAVHPETGEVFFATESGLVSFRAEATAPSTDYSHVYVFPNPVRPDYEGNITVAGLQAGSLVKITDTAGNIIYQNYSTGGQLVWNGLTRTGERLHSGVYLVFASTDNGGEGVVAKFVVVR